MAAGGTGEGRLQREGVQFSADAFAALAVRPGIDKVETLLDGKSAASPEAVQAVDDVNRRLSGLMKPVLPPGVEPRVYVQPGGATMLLTGPSGDNTLQISTVEREHTPFTLAQACPSAAEAQNCEQHAVPGGRVLTWSMVSNGDGKTGTSRKPTDFQYWYLPDDASQPAVDFMLSTVSATGDSSNPVTTDDPLLTVGQFSAAASRTQLADIAAQVVALVK
ncbi:hypothetical protein ACFQ9X_54540 [Catenulispora yoronensis]